MSAPLSLAARLALVKFLTDTLTALRKDDLLPQAAAELPPGSRIPVMFGGQLAGWTSMPKPTQRPARIKDEAALLDWARIHYPAKIEHPAEVVADAGLIEFLQEHRPESLRTGERVDPQWADDLRQAMTDPGYYVTTAGEKLTGVPGIEVPEPDPGSPRVNLEPNAAEIIGQAWAAGDIDFREFLPLTAGDAG